MIQRRRRAIGYPAPFDSLTGLQNLCVLRVIRRDKLMDGVQKFVEDEMGRRYTEPPPFDLPACYDDSSENVTPLVFILSTGENGPEQQRHPGARAQPEHGGQVDLHRA